MQTLPAASIAQPDPPSRAPCRSLRTPDGVPTASIDALTAVLRSGHIYRYNPAPGQISEAALAEEEFAKCVESTYAIGCNSGGSGIFLALHAAGVKPGDEVLCNAVSFTAAPSAIALACAVPILVDANADMTIDLDDLERKIVRGRTKFLLLTHMRGRVADMDSVCSICNRRGLTMVEDCAHTLGTRWKGRHMGSFGVAAAWSCEQKMISAAEGGFVTTNDPSIAATVIIAAGAYDGFFEKHLSKPPREYFERVRETTPCFSMRMTTLAAALIRPQLALLDDRIAHYQRLYAALEASLPKCSFTTLRQSEGVSTSVMQFLQFYLVGFGNHEDVLLFVDACARRGVWLECLGAANKPWNFRTWRYSNTRQLNLPQAESNIPLLIDVKLPLEFDEDDVRRLAEELIAARREVSPEERPAEPMHRLHVEEGDDEDSVGPASAPGAAQGTGAASPMRRLHIEEKEGDDDDDDEATAPGTAQGTSPASSLRRLHIQEEDDDDDEEAPAPGTARGTGAASPMRRLHIEEADDEEG